MSRVTVINCKLVPYNDNNRGDVKSKPKTIKNPQNKKKNEVN